MKVPFHNILVTGGCGFIGSHFIRELLGAPGFSGRVINLDKLTYAGHRENLADVEADQGPDRYMFEQGDIADMNVVASVFSRYPVDAVVHFAAESHVDRSIQGPAPFIYTNLVGTFNLLEMARKAWQDRQDAGQACRFHHVSTDEVYGSLTEDEGPFTETSPYDPRSPYSASKAGSDHLVRAYFHTYGLPVTVSNCSNNYGPFQHPEKLIPVAIRAALSQRPIPVYGTGSNIRDWLFVKDHCRGILSILQKGKPGETYNLGGLAEVRNIDLIHMICDILDEVHPGGSDGADGYRGLIRFVTDRPGHDFRYAMDIKRIRRQLGWVPSTSLAEGLRETVVWYLENGEWIASVSGEAD